MARFTGFDEVFSALYVDFDNIYTRFLEIDPEAARAFGSVPYRWVRWIENHALRILYGEGVRRRILKRMCYLNPQRYQEYRNPFIRSAFQVVDCPPLTTRGKTSTDIHLVMDCMDDLSHSTHFDEFIILSGDADFTPLLIRLQEHARRTLVLSVGYSSPAYTAAASWRIREDWFLQQALRDERADDDDQPVPVVHTPPVASVAPITPVAPVVPVVPVVHGVHGAPMSAITPPPSAARTAQAAPTATGVDDEDEGPSPGNAW